MHGPELRTQLWNEADGDSVLSGMPDALSTLIAHERGNVTRAESTAHYLGGGG